MSNYGVSFTGHTKNVFPGLWPTPQAPLSRYRTQAQLVSKKLVVEDQYPDCIPVKGCPNGSAGVCVLQSTKESSSLMVGSLQGERLSVPLFFHSRTASRACCQEIGPPVKSPCLAQVSPVNLSKIPLTCSVKRGCGHLLPMCKAPSCPVPEQSMTRPRTSKHCC